MVPVNDDGFLIPNGSLWSVSAGWYWAKKPRKGDSTLGRRVPRRIKKQTEIKVCKPKQRARPGGLIEKQPCNTLLLSSEQKFIV